jgi:carboxylesterase type B
MGTDRRPFDEATTTAGPVKGTLRDNGRIADWRGIPYAAPPVGELRWRPPQPPEPWDKIRSCTKYGKRSFSRQAASDEILYNATQGMGLSLARRKLLQTGARLRSSDQSEDCLTLNVRAPAGGRDLPVMVWYHGGNHTDGAGSDSLYDSNTLPERGCVVVTCNYRLGLFGFFAHPLLAEESPDGVSGNYGLLDQIAVLEWVRDNIASFGGDPGQVTIFGESAGGQAVLNLMSSPRAHGLFHRAIAQSPSDSGRWLYLRRPSLDFEPAEEAGRLFAERALSAQAEADAVAEAEHAADDGDRETVTDGDSLETDDGELATDGGEVDAGAEDRAVELTAESADPATPDADTPKADDERTAADAPPSDHWPQDHEAGFDELAALRAMAAEDLVDLYRTDHELGRYFYPLVDGVVLPLPPMSAFSLGVQAPVPLIIGHTADESSVFTGVVHPAGAEFHIDEFGEEALDPVEVRATFERSYPSAAHVDRLMAVYPGLEQLDGQAIASHFSDHQFAVHVEHVAREHYRAGHPVYRYHFRAVPPSPKQTIGSFHSFDVLYVFDSRYPFIPEADDKHLLVREIGDRWFGFAATGVPNFPGRAAWPTYDPADPRHLVLDRPGSGVERCLPNSGVDLMRERIAWLTEHHLEPWPAQQALLDQPTTDDAEPTEATEATEELRVRRTLLSRLPVGSSTPKADSGT